MPTTRPPGPTRAASERVTWPAPQPASRQVIPGAMPAASRKTSVVGPTTRANRSRRRVPSSPPRMAYVIMEPSSVHRHPLVVTDLHDVERLDAETDVVRGRHVHHS